MAAGGGLLLLPSLEPGSLLQTWESRPGAARAEPIASDHSFDGKLLGKNSRLKFLEAVSRPATRLARLDA